MECRYCHKESTVTTPRSSIEQLVEIEALEVLESLGLATRIIPVSRHNHSTQDVAGLATFSSPFLKGQLLMLANFSFYANTLPKNIVNARVLSPECSADWLLVRDWAAELCNLLMSRVKVVLHAHDVKVTSPPPRALSGDPLRTTLNTLQTAWSKVYFASHSNVSIWWNATYAHDLRLKNNPGDHKATAGRVFMFLAIQAAAPLTRSISAPTPRNFASRCS